MCVLLGCPSKAHPVFCVPFCRCVLHTAAAMWLRAVQYHAVHTLGCAEKHTVCDTHGVCLEEEFEEESGGL